MSHVQLTEEQRCAAEHLLTFPKQVQTLGGYAGTGKTTLIRYLKDRLPGWAFAAYTGKAAHVLRRKGIPASTIHGLIYSPDHDEHGQLRWRKTPLLPQRGIIVDEASMVSEPIYNDLLSFGLPIIFVGDHGQLEPVERSKDGKPFNLMTNPDVTLETIHRNAGEISHFAEYVRKGGEPALWGRVQLERYPPGPTRQVQLIDRAEAMPLLEQLIMDREEGSRNSFQVICALNRTRVAWNQAIREVLGRQGEMPVPGDRVMCLENRHQHKLFNGMQGTVRKILYGACMVFESDEGEAITVTYDPDAINAPRRPERSFRDEEVPFDYCWVITCHKSQGDQWHSVFVIDQRCSAFDYKRWAYTAASRAEQRLYWIGGG